MKQKGFPCIGNPFLLTDSFGLFCDVEEYDRSCVRETGLGQSQLVDSFVFVDAHFLEEIIDRIELLGMTVTLVVHGDDIFGFEGAGDGGSLFGVDGIDAADRNEQYIDVSDTFKE